jgi:tetratricopeptide (TPR) repeat protein
VRWAKWLHARLEGFDLGDDLVGRETARGRVPNALRPIFRDRDEFSPGHSLSDETRVALDASAALIVICSPNAAKSHYVNEEIRLFKSRHADRFVIPLIVDDVPGHAQPHCFPSALAFKVTDDGTVTATPDAILAADARKTADGRDLALAKVVASLIGVPVDDVRKRQALTQAWWIKVTAAVVGVVAVLAVVSGFLVWKDRREQVQQAAQTAAQARQLANIQALVEKLTANQPQGAEAPGRKQAITDAVEAAQKGAAAGNTRLARALELLQQGKIADAEPLFRAVADEREQASKAAGREAAEAWRNLGAIAGLADPKKAREAYAHAVALDPDNVNGLLWHGELQKQADNLAVAEDAYRHLIAVKSGTEPDNDVYWARVGLGDIAATRGDLRLAKASYIDAQKIANRRSETEPDNAERQRDLAVSYDRVGNVLVAQGNLTEALKSYRDDLAIMDHLAKADPNNAGWQYDLGISNERIGNVQMAQGDLAAALKSYEARRNIISRLTTADPSNAKWQRDLSVSYNKVGDVLRAQGDLVAALKSYNDSLAIMHRLAKADPNNAGWQRDLSVSYGEVGDVLVAQGNLTEALKSYRDDLAIMDRLAKDDPNNAERQRGLAVSYDRVGNVLVAQGNLTEALKSYRDDLAIMDHLAKADPNNAGWQRDLSISYEKVGDVMVAQGNLTEALKSYNDSLAIRDRLAKSDPNNAEWQRDLIVSCVKMSKVEPAEARRHLTRALEIARDMQSRGRLAPADTWMVDELARRLANLSGD